MGDGRLRGSRSFDVLLHSGDVFRQAAQADTSGWPGGRSHDCRYGEPQVITGGYVVTVLCSPLRVQQWQHAWVPP